MTQDNFIHWLQGYLDGTAAPDAQVIKAKLALIAPLGVPNLAPSQWTTGDLGTTICLRGSSVPYTFPHDAKIARNS